MIYESKQLNISAVVKSIEHLTRANFEIENNKYIFRVLRLKEHEFINFISVTELKRNVRVSVAFSYSRFEKSGDNYNLCTRERTIQDTHAAVVRLFRSITGILIKHEELEITALDISNQLQVESIRNYYTVLDIIYRALKRNEPNGRLYFDIDKDRRKQLDGLDFRERGKKRREASSYFKIYSKRKEEEATGKSTAGHVAALRGELTLKGQYLKKQGLSRLSGVTKENLERVLRNTLADVIISGINEEIKLSLEHLRKVFVRNGTKKIRENILLNEYHIFDEKLIDIILIPEIMRVGDRQCRNLKKQVLEVLAKSSENGEIKKTYSGNFKRLEKLLKKVVKVDIIIDITKTGVNISWENKDLQERQK